MIAKNSETIYVVERIDDLGPYCHVWTDSTPEGGEAEYENLEAAAWAIVAHARKTGTKPNVEVYGDDAEFGRWTKAVKAAEQSWNQIERIARAPRCKRTGRPLFVSY